MNNKRKVLYVSVLMMLVSLAGMSQADTEDITGTFNPTASVSASVDDTTFAFGSLSADSNSSEQFANITNTGDINIDVTIYYQSTASDLTIQTDWATYNASKSDRYIMWENGSTPGTWTSMKASGSAETLISNLSSSGVHRWKQMVTLGTITEDWNEQTHTDRVEYVAHT